MRRALPLLAILAFAVPVFAQNTRTESRTVTSNGTVALDVSGMGTASITASGTFSATLTFRGYGDPNGDPVTILCAAPATPSTTVSSASAAGAWICPVAGLRGLEVAVSSYVSGPVKIYMTAAPGGGGSSGSTTLGDITASPASTSATGAAVPSEASYTGINIGGNLTGLTGFSLGSARAGAVAIVDGSGAQITSFGGGTQYATASATGTPTGTVALGWDGSNVRAVTTTAAGNLSVAQSGTWNVTNISGTISLPTGAATSAAQTTAQTSLSSIVTNTTGVATAANQTTLNGHVDGLETLVGTTNTELGNLTNTIGATTSGSTGTLFLGAVTTSAPTYTTAQLHPFSLQTDGALRVGGSISCSNCSGSGASSVDNSAWTFGTTSGAGAMFVVDETSTNSVTENSVGTARMSALRIPYANVRFSDVAASVGSGVNGTGVLRVNEATDSALSSDTAAIRAAVESSATSLDTIQTNLSADAVQGNAVIATGPQKMLEAKDQDGSALPNSVTEGQAVRAAGSLNGVQYAMLVNEDGSAVGSVAQSGTWTMQPGNTANTTPWLTSLSATAAAQGCTPGSIISAASVNETEIKGSAGQLYMLNVTNVGSAAVYFKIYNDTAANTDETDTPIQRFVIPGATTGAGNAVQVPAVGIVFSAGITFRITSAIADNSTAVIAANEVLVSYCYK